MDLSDALGSIAGPHWEVRAAGGGTIVAPGIHRNSSIELHVLPHCGTTVPEAWLGGNHHEDAVSGLVNLMFANYDAGTSAVAERLILERPLPDRDVVIAYFNVSRLFLDANRLDSTGQIPANPYVGTNDLYRAFQLSHGEALRERLLLPWIREVNELIRGGNVEIVYHHHTFERFSRGTRVYDTRPRQERPLGQLFWRKPSISESVSQSAGLMPRETLEDAAAWVRAAIEAPHGGVAIDDPLLAPAMPFHGCTATGLGANDEVWHFVYELRKDALEGPDRLRGWADALGEIRNALWSRRMHDRQEPGPS
jgi:hypothetical protein